MTSIRRETVDRGGTATGDFPTRCSELVSRMPNDRRGRRKARRVKPTSRMRVAPVLFFGLVAAAVLGNAPSGEPPLRWANRNADVWMADWDGVRDVRLAAAAAAVHQAANQLPLSMDGPVVAPKPMVAAREDAEAKPTVVAAADAKPTAATDAKPAVVADAKPVVVATLDVKPIVVAEADQPPRDVPKVVPDNVIDPDVTGSVPSARQVPPADQRRVPPTINRGGKSDRLYSPAPLGRTTDRDIFTKPTLAVVPPSQDGWPPVATIASWTAPQSEKSLPRVAIAKTPETDREPIVVAMVRSGPGRVVTPSVVATVTVGKPGHNRVLLPPVPEGQVAQLPPRSRVWAQPDVPMLGYAKSNDVEYRFKSLLGDEEQDAAAKTGDDQLPP